MDGGAGLKEPKKDESGEFTVFREFTPKEAARTLPFWAFSLTFCLNGFIGTALGFHAQSMAPEFGLEPTELYALFAKSIFVNIPVSFAIGWMTSRFRLKFAYLLSVSAMIVSLTGFLNFPTGWGIALFIVGTGVTWGSFGTLLTVTWPRYYGRKHLGKISSWVMTLMVITSALGPMFFDMSEVLTGNYRMAFYGSIGLCLLILTACVGVVNPQRRFAPSVP